MLVKMFRSPSKLSRLDDPMQVARLDSYRGFLFYAQGLTSIILTEHYACWRLHGVQSDLARLCTISWIQGPFIEFVLIASGCPVTAAAEGVVLERSWSRASLLRPLATCVWKMLMIC